MGVSKCSLLEKAPHFLHAFFEVDLVRLAIRGTPFPLSRFLGALHPTEVIHFGPEEADRRPVDGGRHGPVLGLEKEFRFSALSICHNDTALLVNNTDQFATDLLGAQNSG